MITSIIGLGASYLLFYLFLKRGKSFHFNRFFLLGSLILCLLAPVLELEYSINFAPAPKTEVKDTNPIFFQQALPEVTTVEKIKRENKGVLQTLFWGYLVLSLFLLVRFFRNLFEISTYIKKNNTFDIAGLRAISIAMNKNPYSFFHFLFINEGHLKNKQLSEAIIQHERAHSTQFHSADVIFIELLTCFFWFNPFLWLYKKAIVQNHEFLADAQVINAGSEIASYSQQIIKLGNKNLSSPLLSGFNFNQTKNRIMMLHKKRTPKTLMNLKIGVVLSLFAFIFTLAACTMDQANQENKPFIVVLDAGHGGTDPGASNEKDVALQIAKKLAALSNEKEIEIILTRKEDSFLSLGARVAVAKNQNADMLLSLHCNFSNDETKTGVVAFYARNGKAKEASYEQSKILVSNYVNEITEQGEINEAGFFLLRKLEIPGVLLNLGYLSNEKEAKQLKNPEFQQKIAENIYESLKEIRENG